MGTPRVCRPADYLPSGTVGQWPPATGQWWNERRGGDPKTDQRKEELSKQLGCEGRGPENPGVVAPLIFCKLSRQLFVLRCTSIPVRRQRPQRCYEFLHLVTSLYIRHRVHRGISFPACRPASLLFRASFGWTRWLHPSKMKLHWTPYYERPFFGAGMYGVRGYDGVFTSIVSVHPRKLLGLRNHLRSVVGRGHDGNGRPLVPSFLRHSMCVRADLAAPYR